MYYNDFEVINTAYKTVYMWSNQRNWKIELVLGTDAIHKSGEIHETSVVVLCFGVGYCAALFR